MAVYTLSFKELYDLTDSKKSWEERVEDTANNLFNFNFPWYNDNADKSLDLFKKMFVENHFTDEIGFETLGLFKMKMQSVFYEKIPYYTDLYKALHIEYDPLLNSDMHRIDDGTNNTKTTGSDKSEHKEKTNSSDDWVGGETIARTHNVDTDFDQTIKHNMKHITNNAGGYNDTLTHTGTESTTSKSTVENDGKTTTTVSGDNNTQTLTSDFPQANFSTKKDYAKNLERGEEKTNSTTETSDNSSAISNGESTTTYNTTNSNSGNKSSTDTMTAEDSDITHSTEGVLEKDSYVNSDHRNTTTFSDVNGNVSRETLNDSKNATHNEGRSYGWVGGSKTDELEKYRKSIRNLNEMLLREFDDLFMVVYEPYDGRTWLSPIERGLLS